MSSGRWIAIGIVALLGAGGAAYGIHAFTARDADDADEEVAAAQSQPIVAPAGSPASAVALRPTVARKGAAAQTEKTWNFDQDKPGQIARIVRCVRP